jgi:hypothetical protein
VQVEDRPDQRQPPHFQTKSPAFDRAWLPNEQRCKSEFGRQIAVDFKADADLNECWRTPSHVLLLMLAANKVLYCRL